MNIAIAQIITAKADPDTNLRRMEESIRRAAARGAQLVCFSELFYSGYDVDTAAVERLAVYRDGPQIRSVCRMAAAHGVHLLLSYPERDRTDGKVYIASLLASPEGDVLCAHRKTYLWGDEGKTFSRGSGYSLCDTVFGRVGLLICYEMEFPEPARILALQGAQILLVTSAFNATEQMRRYLSAIAIHNQCWVVGVNDVRPEPPLRGMSCVVDPYGETVAALEREEGLLLCRIDPAGDDRRRVDPHMKDLRPDTFSLLAAAARGRFCDPAAEG